METNYRICISYLQTSFLFSAIFVIWQMKILWYMYILMLCVPQMADRPLTHRWRNPTIILTDLYCGRKQITLWNYQLDKEERENGACLTLSLRLLLPLLLLLCYQPEMSYKLFKTSWLWRLIICMSRAYVLRNVLRCRRAHCQRDIISSTRCY
jgi:hypothetical protein